MRGGTGGIELERNVEMRARRAHFAGAHQQAAHQGLHFRCAGVAPREVERALDGAGAIAGTQLRRDQHQVAAVGHRAFRLERIENADRGIGAPGRDVAGGELDDRAGVRTPGGRAALEVLQTRVEIARLHARGAGERERDRGIRLLTIARLEHRQRLARLALAQARFGQEPASEIVVRLRREHRGEVHVRLAEIAVRVVDGAEQELGRPVVRVAGQDAFQVGARHVVLAAQERGARAQVERHGTFRRELLQALDRRIRFLAPAERELRLAQSGERRHQPQPRIARLRELRRSLEGSCRLFELTIAQEQRGQQQVRLRIRGRGGNRDVRLLARGGEAFRFEASGCKTESRRHVVGPQRQGPLELHHCLRRASAAQVRIAAQYVQAVAFRVALGFGRIDDFQRIVVAARGEQRARQRNREALRLHAEPGRHFQLAHRRCGIAGLQRGDAERHAPFRVVRLALQQGLEVDTGRAVLALLHAALGSREQLVRISAAGGKRHQRRREGQAAQPHPLTWRSPSTAMLFFSSRS